MLRTDEGLVQGRVKYFVSGRIQSRRGICKMLKCLKRSCYCRMAFPARLLAASVVLLLFFQSACVLSRKSKAPMAAIAPVRVVLLPFNVPENSKDLRWAAMASPILMAKVAEQAPDLVVVPLWEAMPTAIQSAGASRIFTQEEAASVANWLSARWSIMGAVFPAKTGLSLMVDFIPAKTTQIPFRYIKTGEIDSLEPDFHAAFRQFLRYLVARPLEPVKKEDEPSATALKNLAEALDREYGWFVSAEPGKAGEAVANLVSSDKQLARLLFNPSLYPELAKTK
jgi:hypothetical protein